MEKKVKDCLVNLIQENLSNPPQYFYIKFQGKIVDIGNVRLYKSEGSAKAGILEQIKRSTYPFIQPLQGYFTKIQNQNKDLVYYFKDTLKFTYNDYCKPAEKLGPIRDQLLKEGIFEIVEFK